MSIFACLIQVYDMYRCTLAVMYSSMYGLMYCIDTYILGLGIGYNFQIEYHPVHGN